MISFRHQVLENFLSQLCLRVWVTCHLRRAILSNFSAIISLLWIAICHWTVSRYRQYNSNWMELCWTLRVSCSFCLLQFTCALFSLVCFACSLMHVGLSSHYYSKSSLSIFSQSVSVISLLYSPWVIRLRFCSVLHFSPLCWLNIYVQSIDRSLPFYHGVFCFVWCK